MTLTVRGPPPPTTTTTAPPGGYELWVSGSVDRSNPNLLAGETVAGDIYAFTLPEAGVTVTFWLDDREMTGPPHQVEGRRPV